MGTFVTNPTEELFEDKESAPGLTLRPGWTLDNVTTADDMNALKGACNDLRDAHLALASTVADISASATPTPDTVVKSLPDGTIDSGWLPVADASNAGALSAGAQSIGGNKVFTGTITAPGFVSGSSNPAPAGTLRMARADGIGWTDNAGTSYVTLGVSTANRLQFGGANVPTVSSTDTLTNKTLTSPTITGATLTTTASLGFADGTSMTTAASSGSDARAQTTPAASKIPLADGSGKIAEGWLPTTLTSKTLSGGTLSGTIGGNPTFSGNVTVDGILQTNNDLISPVVTTDEVFSQATTLSLSGSATNGASAIGVKVGNYVPLTTAGAQIIAFYPDDPYTSSSVAHIDKTGQLKVSGGVKFSDSTVQTTSPLATPSVAIGTLTTPSSFNLSTEGTTDWVDSNGLTVFNPNSNSGNIHHKVDGDGTMFRTLRFFAGGATNVVLQAGTDSPFTKSTTATDDTFTAALSATTYTRAQTADASQVGYGFQFDVPAKTTSQTLNLYCGVFSGVITLSFTLRDGTTTSTTITAGAGTSSQKKVPVTFTGKNDADKLRVKVKLTTNSGSSPNVQFYCATLA